MLNGFLALSGLGLLVFFVGAGYIYFKYSDGLPDVLELKNYQPSTISRVYDDQDDLLAEFYIEKRILIPFREIPLRMKQATLAVEDSNFYYHFGLDPKAIVRAIRSGILRRIAVAYMDYSSADFNSIVIGWRIFLMPLLLRTRCLLTFSGSDSY